MNVTAKRVVAAMAAAGIDQPALAAELGVSQGSISKIVSGKTLNSRLLPRIAVRLRQSLPYLLGETDDPGAAPPTPPAPTVVLMRVQLPDVDSLTAMFEGLLDGIDPALSQDARARLLAERLPIGLSQLADAQPGRPHKRRPAAREEARADLAMSDHGS